VLPGGSGEAKAFGPAAILDLPQSGVTVLAAHRDTHFEFVRDLEAGNALTLERIDGSKAGDRITSLSTLRREGGGTAVGRRWEGGGTAVGQRWYEFTCPVSSHAALLALTTCYLFGSDTPGPLRRVV
jgi:sortase A